MAPPAPAPAQLRRCPCSAALWAPSPFHRRLPRRRSAAAPFIGRQGYSHSPGLGAGDNRALTPGLKFKWQVQINEQSKPSYAQEWLEESKRLCSLRTTNSVLNHVFNGSLEDCSVRERMAPSSVGKRHAGVELAKHHVMSPTASAMAALTSAAVKDVTEPLNGSVRSEGIRWPNGSNIDASLPEIGEARKSLQFDGKARDGYDEVEHECTAKTIINDDIEPLNMPSGSEVEIQLPNGSKVDASLPKIRKVKKSPRPASADKAVDGHNDAEHECADKTTVQPSPAKAPLSEEAKEAREALATLLQ